MVKYWELAKSQMKIDSAYTAWFWAETFSSILRLLITYYFWYAVYEKKDSIQGIDFKTMLTYIVVAMIIEQYVSGVGNSLSRQIQDGSIVLELLKPYHIINKLISLDIGSKISSFFRATFPIIIIAFFFLDLKLPTNPLTYVYFLISFMFGSLIGAQIDLMIGIVAFWTVNVWGVRVLREAIIKFFSGALIPLSLFPNWFQNVSDFLPFQSMVYIPTSIFTGQISSTSQILWSIVIQLIWLISMYILLRVLWSIAIRKITIFGG
jgi:ABC-2 type transport system permease protein